MTITTANSTAEEKMLDRARGALIGLAVGDALGSTLEFQTRDTMPLHTQMIGGGPFRLQPGVWTDDTSMALALADSLAHSRGFDPKDLMDRFTSWWRSGKYSATGTCFDIGNTTRASLEAYAATGNPFSGTTDEHQAGNGSLMRIAPVAIYAFRDAALCDELAADQSRTTHGAPQAVAACVFFARLLREAIQGEQPCKLFATKSLPGTPFLDGIASGGWKGKPRAAIRSSGYVLDTLEAALWAVEQTTSFKDALILAVNLADDADTVGAVTGQLAGAIYGSSQIPQEWLTNLAWLGRLENISRDLYYINEVPFTDKELLELMKRVFASRHYKYINLQMPANAEVNELNLAINKEYYRWRSYVKYYRRVGEFFDKFDELVDISNELRKPNISYVGSISDAFRHYDGEQGTLDADYHFHPQLNVMAHASILDMLQDDLLSVRRKYFVDLGKTVFRESSREKKWHYAARNIHTALLRALRSRNPDFEPGLKRPVPLFVTEVLNRFPVKEGGLAMGSVKNLLFGAKGNPA